MHRLKSIAKKKIVIEWTELWKNEEEQILYLNAAIR